MIFYWLDDTYFMKKEGEEGFRFFLSKSFRNHLRNLIFLSSVVVVAVVVGLFLIAGRIERERGKRDKGIR